MGFFEHILLVDLGPRLSSYHFQAAVRRRFFSFSTHRLSLSLRRRTFRGCRFRRFNRSLGRLQNQWCVRGASWDGWFWRFFHIFRCMFSLHDSGCCPEGDGLNVSVLRADGKCCWMPLASLEPRDAGKDH